jgi:NTP pyrophosphatase (non-canonical NTP hydrolase)
MTTKIFDMWDDGQVTLTRRSLGKGNGHSLQLDVNDGYINLSVNDCAKLCNALSAFVHEQVSASVVAYPMTLTIERAQLLNRVRADRWHGGDFRNWTILEWAGAMCGEAGEAANVAKKIRRLEMGLSGNESSEHKVMDLEALRRAFGRECADTFMYLVLLAECGRVSLADEVRAAFNAKSEEMNFPERL